METKPLRGHPERSRFSGGAKDLALTGQGSPHAAEVRRARDDAPEVDRDGGRKAYRDHTVWPFLASMYLRRTAFMVVW